LTLEKLIDLIDVNGGITIIYCTI